MTDKEIDLTQGMAFKEGLETRALMHRAEELAEETGFKIFWEKDGSWYTEGEGRPLIGGQTPRDACFYLYGFKAGQGVEPERIQGHAEMEDGLVTFDLQVRADGSAVGVGTLPDGQEIPTEVPADIVKKMRQGKVNMSIESITAHTEGGE